MDAPAQSLSPWADTAKRRLHPLSADASADVCIVGAGIAGLTTAYCLAQKQVSVIVLDDGVIGGGETERTTAHITHALDDRYWWLEKIHGEENARLAAESHTAAIDFIDETVQKEKIDCAFRRLSGYLFLNPDDPVSILEREQEALGRVGLSGVELLQQAPFSSFTTGPALHFPAQGEFHVLQYLEGLSKAVGQSKGNIFTGTHVSDVQEEKDGTWRVKTSGGNTVTAKSVVIATNAPVIDNVRIYGQQEAYRTYVIAGKIPKGSVEKALFWDTPEARNHERPIGYHYIRTAEYSAEHDLLIVGGEDHKTGQENRGPLHFANLERWTRDRFPMMGELAYRWSGQVMEPFDGLAFIGRHPSSNKNLYIATGDSGNGITHGTIAGKLLTDLILDTPNAWEELYDPSRTRLKSGKEFLRGNANVASVIGRDLFKKNPKRPEEALENESGMVVRKGFKTRIALYRDAEGTLHKLSAICPHKGCIVRWNSLEKSWDCPCHGSRFTATGEVVNGPSIENLKPLA